MIRIFGTEIKPTIFPDNTSQIWKLSPEFLNMFFIKIEWDFDSESEIMHLSQLVDLLKHNNPKVVIDMVINYLPYARQDKEIGNENTFALHSFAKIINNMELNNIFILDPHSTKALELIKRSSARSPLKFINAAIKECVPDVICFPDKGAKERYRYIGFENVIYAEKIRNQLTGELSGCTISDVNLIPDKNILIIDDLCDGGGTFINLAKELYINGVNEVYLYTTHGIYSKGLTPIINSRIKRVFSKLGEHYKYQRYTEYQDTFKPWEKI